MKNKKGFTIVELLIVVAIIGVLVAVSIPIFTTQLKKSRLAANQANARAAYAAALSTYMFEKPTSFLGGGAYCSYVYDIKTGTGKFIAVGTDWDRNKEHFINYLKGDTEGEHIDTWTLNTKDNNNKAVLGDEVYEKWKVDIRLSDGAVYAICWE